MLFGTHTATRRSMTRRPSAARRTRRPVPAARRLFVEQLEDRRVMTAAAIAAIPVGSWPVGLAGNPVISRTYVANNDSGTVSVIDDATNTLLSTINLGVGTHPSTVGVDPGTNRVFVVQDNTAAADDTVAVIDGTPGSPTENTVVATIPVPGRYLAMSNTMAVNPTTHRVYIPSFDPGGQVVVIDGVSNSLLSLISVAANPLSAAYDSVHNRVYVGHGAFFMRSQLTIIDAATHAVSNGPNVGIGQYDLGVNPGTNTLYVHKGDPGRGSPYGVAVVDTVTNTVTTTIPGGASAFGGVGVDASARRIYVADSTLDAVRIIDGAVGSPTQNTVIATVAIGDQPRGLAVNPALGRVYVATTGVNAVSVVADVYSETNRFRPAAQMLVDHGYQFTLTKLQDGRLLAIGGNPASGGITAAAEIYDPQTGAWSLTGSLNTQRDGHSATLLPDGRVLIAGGSNATGTLASAELFDPQTGAFSPAGSMVQARSGHTAILLDNGKVLVAAGGVGGAGDTFGLASAELFDPGTGTWTPTGSLNVARMNHAGARLLDGRVLVAGGQDRGVTFQNFSSAEVYNPATGTWSLTTTPMITARRGGFLLTTLASGQVLVAGGGTDWTSITTANAELFDPATATWSATTPLPAALNSYSATRLADGRVLIAGGNDHPAHFGPGTYVDTGYLFDPATQLWLPTANELSEVRANHRAAPLPDGSVLIAGGWNGTTTVPSAEIFGVPNSAPVAQAGGPYSVPEGGSVQLDASGTTDADLPWDVLTYAWDFDGDGQYDDAVGPTPFFSAAALDGPTTVSVGLRVMDAARTSSTGTATIAVANVAPTVSISGPDSGLVARPYTFAFSATDPSAADMAAPLAYAIDWGDGQTTTVSGPAGGTTRSHVYADFGDYSVTVTAADKDGGTSLVNSHSFVIDTAASVVIDADDFGPNEDNAIVVRREVDNVVVTVDGLVVLDTAMAGLTGGLAIDGAAGNDILTVEFSGGDPIPVGGLNFDGGEPASGPPGDAMVLDQETWSGSFHTITHTLLNESDGSISLDPDGPGGDPASTISYTGLEPVSDNLGAVDRIFTFQAGPETITLQDIADVGGNQMQIDSDVGSETVQFANPSGSLTINAGSGDDIVTVASVDPAFNASLIINGDEGNDTVNLNGDITFASGNYLDVDLTDDAWAGDADRITVGAGANLVLSGSGTATLKASRNVALASGSSVEVVDGNLTVEANQQATPTVGNFVGVDVDGGLLQSTGTGIVTIKGRGGNDSGGDQYGVYVRGGGEIAGGTSGT
ncbi:MAG TPA: kelch repeat-containing protein, partial [Candidatus Anammoximicrobium sp.]|nr:kelch repeat-containing protein [Candidatus Anammoximicrobium sp.]